MKQCSICKKKKELDLFVVRANKTDGRGIRCKSCQADVERERRNKKAGRAVGWKKSAVDYSVCPDCSGERYKRPFPQLGWRCKKCEALRMRESRIENPENVRRIQRETYYRVRIAAVKKLGSKCVKCGYTDPRALQIDHINGGGTKEHREIGNGRVYKKVLKNTDGYQLLCANCNWVKRWNNGEGCSSVAGKKYPVIL